MFLECALEDETYEDGAETQMECNRCVCACGNWVCTAVICDGELKPGIFSPAGVETRIWTAKLDEMRFFFCGMWSDFLFFLSLQVQISSLRLRK